MGRTDPKTSDPFFPMTPGILTARTSPFLYLEYHRLDRWFWKAFSYE
ncbi:hypothetical protein [Clostridium neonatale]|nr:hypothetical protein [Clostridium neonatale]